MTNTSSDSFDNLCSAGAGLLIGATGGSVTLAAAFFAAAATRSPSAGGITLVIGGLMTLAAGLNTKNSITGFLTTAFGAIAGPALIAVNSTIMIQKIDEQYFKKTPQAISTDCSEKKVLNAVETLKRQGVNITCAP